MIHESVEYEIRKLIDQSDRFNERYATVHNVARFLFDVDKQVWSNTREIVNPINRVEIYKVHREFDRTI